MARDELVVGPEEAGERLDVFLARSAGSRAAAQRLIDAGLVRVDGVERPKRHAVAAGERIAVGELPPEPEPEVPDATFSVAYEDDHLLVVDKPAGVVVHPARGHRAGTLAQALAGRIAGGEDTRRQGIVHRLDRDTSGLLVVARTEAAYEALKELLRTRAITREYLALVEGRPAARKGTIDAPIGRDRVHRTLVSTRSDRPRTAVTHFEVLERLPRTALLDVRLETGRTHQIRAHLAAIGHPVVGDTQYGGRESGRRLGLPRQFLHASRLMFSHPFTRELVRCESKPPVELSHALDTARREPVSGGPDGG
jgi:23S rRNA pseudouridine1911/1915/1917 synthase